MLLRNDQDLVKAYDTSRVPPLTKMFKPTPSLQRSIRRLALTTKQGPKDYYKGTRTGSMGRHTKHGTYKIEWEKVRTYVYPENMADFEVGKSFLSCIAPGELLIRWTAYSVCLEARGACEGQV